MRYNGGRREDGCGKYFLVRGPIGIGNGKRKMKTKKRKLETGNGNGGEQSLLGGWFRVGVVVVAMGLPEVVLVDSLVADEQSV